MKYSMFGNNWSVKDIVLKQKEEGCVYKGRSGIEIEIFLKSKGITYFKKIDSFTKESLDQLLLSLTNDDRNLVENFVNSDQDVINNHSVQITAMGM